MSYRYTSHPHFGFDLFKGSGFGNGNVVIGGFGYGLGMGIGAGDGPGVGKEIEVGGVNCLPLSGPLFSEVCRRIRPGLPIFLCASAGPVSYTHLTLPTKRIV